MRKSIDAAIAERRLLEVGLALIDKPTVIEDLANDANRARLAIDAAQETRAALELRLKDIKAERLIALDQNRKRWMDDDDTQRVPDELSDWCRSWVVTLTRRST